MQHHEPAVSNQLTVSGKLWYVHRPCNLSILARHQTVAVNLKLSV